MAAVLSVSVTYFDAEADQNALLLSLFSQLSCPLRGTAVVRRSVGQRLFVKLNVIETIDLCRAFPRPHCHTPIYHRPDHIVQRLGKA